MPTNSGVTHATGRPDGKGKMASSCWHILASIFFANSPDALFSHLSLSLCGGGYLSQPARRHAVPIKLPPHWQSLRPLHAVPGSLSSVVMALLAFLTRSALSLWPMCVTRARSSLGFSLCTVPNSAMWHPA
ncbi:unnamed protein product [Chrysoparadoxa australica]